MFKLFAPSVSPQRHPFGVVKHAPVAEGVTPPTLPEGPVRFAPTLVDGELRMLAVGDVHPEAADQQRLWDHYTHALQQESEQRWASLLATPTHQRSMVRQAFAPPQPKAKVQVKPEPPAMVPPTPVQEPPKFRPPWARVPRH